MAADRPNAVRSVPGAGGRSAAAREIRDGDAGASARVDEARVLVPLSHTNAYRPQDPATTERRRTGDCKDRSLWLADKLGADSVRFVIGKAQAKAKLNHAWLVWSHEGQTWLLDPTNSAVPMAADSAAAAAYVPFYAYARTGKFAPRGDGGSTGGAAEPARAESSALTVGVRDPVKWISRAPAARRRPSAAAGAIRRHERNCIHHAST